MVKYSNIFFSIVSIAFIIGIAPSKSAAQEIWTLEKCIKTAWDNNLNLANSDLATQASKIQERQAKEARYPTLNLSSGLNLNFGRSIDPTSNSFVAENFLSNNVSVNSGVVLFDGFRIRDRIKQSAFDTEASKKDKAQLERDIALSVASSYLNLLFAKENLTIATNTLAQSQQQLDQIKKMIGAGARAESEAFDSEALLASNERQMVIAQNNKDIALLQLKQLMLVEKDIDVVSPENLLVETDANMLQLDELFQSAILHQESLKAAELRSKSSELGVKLAQSQQYPTLSLGGSLGTSYSNKGIRIDGFNEEIINQNIIFNGQQVEIGFIQDVPLYSNNPYFNQFDENISYGFGLNLSMPIYNNYQIKGSIENAKLNSQRSQNDLELLKQNLRTTIQQALADARAARSTLAANEKALLTQRRAYENAQRKFDLGSGNSFELTNQKSRLDNAVLNVLVSKYDYIFKSKVIDFYMGKQIKI